MKTIGDISTMLRRLHSKIWVEHQSGHQSSLSPSSQVFILLVIIAVAFLLRSYRLTTQSLWIDEGMSILFTNCTELFICIGNMVASPTADKFYPAYYIILYAWRELFGSSEAAIRALSLVFGVATIPVMWLAARRLFDRVHATWAVAFLAVSAFGVYYGQEAKPYSMYSLLAALQIWLLASHRDSSKYSSRRLAFIGVTFLGSWCGPYFMLFTLALTLADLIERQRLGQWFLWWLPAGLVCLPALAYLAAMVMQTPPDQVASPMDPVSLLSFAFIFIGNLVGQTFGPPLVELRGADQIEIALQYWTQLAVLGLVCLIIGYKLLRLFFAGRLFQSQDRGERLIGLAILVYFLLIFTFGFLTGHGVRPRHAFALHLFLALLLPLAGRPVSPNKYPTLFGAMTVMISVCLLNIFSLYQYYFDSKHWRDDYRGVANYLAEKHDLGVPSVMVLGNLALLRYYGNEETINGEKFTLDNLDLSIKEATDNARKVLVVVNREFYYHPEKQPGAIESGMQPLYELSNITTFQYFKIYSFEMRHDSSEKGSAHSY